jgi:hypothetical protein
MIKLAKEIDKETLASIIRQGILRGSSTLYGHQYLQVIVILSNRYPNLISFKDSGNTLVDFKVKREFYDVLKKEDQDLYKYLVDPYLIMEDLKVDISKVIVDCLNEIVRILRQFNKTYDLVKFLEIVDEQLITNAYVQFEMIKQGNANFVSLVVERFFCDVIEKLEQDGSSIIETVKQAFLQLVYDNIAEIKLYLERNYYVNLHSVVGTGIVYKIYVAINNAKDTFKPFEVVSYDVSESDFVSYALQTLRHTGNFGIAVKILDTAFVVVVPSNRLDIVKC